MKAVVNYSYLDDAGERISDQIEVEMPFDREAVIDAAKMLLIYQEKAEIQDFYEKKFAWHEVQNATHDAEAELLDRTDDCAKLVARIKELEETCDMWAKRTGEADRLICEIRDEVMQYPMSKTAEGLVNTLYELLR